MDIYGHTANATSQRSKSLPALETLVCFLAAGLSESQRVRMFTEKARGGAASGPEQRCSDRRTIAI